MEQIWNSCSKQTYQNIGQFYNPLQQTCFGHMENLVGSLIVSNQVLKERIQSEQEQQTSVLLSSEITTIQHTLHLKDLCSLIDVAHLSQKLRDIKYSLADLQQECRATINAKKIHQCDLQIMMQHKKIIKTKQKEWWWFQEMCPYQV